VPPFRLIDLGEVPAPTEEPAGLLASDDARRGPTP
jgi:hypothetical protein